MIPSIVRLVVSLFDVKETVPSLSIFGLDPCTLFCSMVGSILIFSCFNRLLLPNDLPWLKVLHMSAGLGRSPWFKVWIGGS